MSKGGKREGAGRPPAPPSAVLRIRLPLPLHQKVKELGGDIWVKRIINEAIEKKGGSHENHSAVPGAAGTRRRTGAVQVHDAQRGGDV
jgi:hypothetical protein